MSKQFLTRAIFGAVTLLGASASFAQMDMQIRPRQMTGWDPRAREGRCEIRVWVDNRAEVRMRGDGIYVKTLEGSRARDEGSQCSQPIPYNAITNFQVRQLAGRSRVVLAQPPNRMNNFAAMIVIEDRQGGGDQYAFEVTWQAEPNISTLPNAPAPFFDEVRGCQDYVRQQFLSRNGRGTYIDFDNFADRQSMNNGRGRGRGRGGRNMEIIQGHGRARTRFESRDINYTCTVDTVRDLVVNGTYEYQGDGMRTNDRTRLK